MSTAASPVILSRRERERLQRRHQMLDAAQEVIAEKGYAQATLEEIAQRAEFGKGTLYNYFPEGKQEILLAIVEQFHDELCEVIERTFPHSNTPSFREALEAFLEQTFRFFMERSELFMTILREAHRIGFSDDPGPRQFFAEQRERALAALSAPIERAMNDGQLRMGAPRFWAHMILININGAQMKACMGNDAPAHSFPTDSRTMAHSVTSLLMDGMAERSDA